MIIIRHREETAQVSEKQHQNLHYNLALPPVDGPTSSTVVARARLSRYLRSRFWFMPMSWNGKKNRPCGDRIGGNGGENRLSLCNS